MRPAGMIRQAMFSLPIKDRSSLLRHLLQVDQDWSSDINLWSLSSGREVSMQVVSIRMPRNTRRVVGPSSLLGYAHLRGHTEDGLDVVGTNR